MMKSNTAQITKKLLNPNQNFYRTKERNYFGKVLSGNEVMKFPISAYSGAKNVNAHSREHKYNGPYQF